MRQAPGRSARPTRDSLPLEPILADGSARPVDRDSHQRHSDRIAWANSSHRRSNSHPHLTHWCLLVVLCSADRAM